MEKLIETIERLLKEKESKRIEPCVVTWIELIKERNKMDHDEANRLYKEKSIDIVRLINGYGIRKRGK